MIKTFLILINFTIFLHASQQIVLVVADNLNTHKAKLECYEGDKRVFPTMDVNIGKKGLGLGIGELQIDQNSSNVFKKEGDKKAPIGVFKLSSIFGYSKSNNFKLPYTQVSKNLICVDDSDSKYYNKIIYKDQDKPKSFEEMKRDDLQYELGIVVEHNKDGVAQKGSCIFIHVEKAPDTGTAGCTSMTLENLRKITSWLDKDKNPILVQIPKASSNEVLELYPELLKSKLLK